LTQLSGFRHLASLFIQLGYYTYYVKIMSQKVKLMKYRLCVTIDEEIVARIDNEKGALVPRSIFLNELLKKVYAVKDGETSAC